MLAITDEVQGYNYAFTYDKLNRLASAQTSDSNLWGNTYTYDAWGNLTNKTQIPGKGGEYFQQPVDGNNRFIGSSYDAAGNLLAIPGHTFTYDPENQIRSVDGTAATYVYSTEGERVKKIVGGNVTWYTGSPVLQEVTNGAWSKDYIYLNGLGGELIASESAAEGTHYYFNDHLGTPRVIAEAPGNVIPNGRHDYYPFGGEITTWSDGETHKFTGKERDTETGLDYFGARYYGSNMARFTSPDPKTLALRHLLNPQKLNKYSYVLNNPLALFDPDGQEEKTITYRAFIPTQTTSVAGFTYAGDNRSFSTAKNASSRVSLSVTIETDAAKNPSGLVSMGKPQVGMSIELSPTIKTRVATQGLPHADVSRDANGNVVVNFQSNAKNPIGPAGQSLEPGIRADATVKVSPDGTQASAGGVFSGYPSHEINMTDSNGTVPLLQVPAGNQPTDLLKNTVVPPQETMRPPACATDKKGCN